MQLIEETFDRALRVPQQLRSRALRFGAVALAVGAACIAAPVLAHDGPKAPPPACGSTLPLTTPCTPSVVAPATATGAYTVTLPGVGTLSFKIDAATNTITSPTVTGLGANFTASTPKISADGTRVSVTFTNSADPAQVYRLKIKVKPPETAGGAPVVKAKVRGNADWHSEHKRHHGEREREGGR